MRKVRGLIGMPVVCNGHRIGCVLRADLSEDLRGLEGLWISRGLRGSRYIPAESLETLGRVAVIADSVGMRKRANTAPLFYRAVSTGGERLGAITGAEIDELSFRVVALELSAGLWDDLLHKRARVTQYVVNRENGLVIVDQANEETEAVSNERRNDEGLAHGYADRRLGGNDIRRHELADGEEVESEGQTDRKLDF